jgi:hypothetical protein
MRVKAGEFQKEIPARYERAVELLTLADWEKPEKIRLTPMERFKFAEAAWRMEQPKLVQEYLEGCNPEQIIEQTNRLGEIRYVVRYDEIHGVNNQSIVPNWVARACPRDLRSFQNENWIA